MRDNDRTLERDYGEKCLHLTRLAAIKNESHVHVCSCRRIMKKHTSAFMLTSSALEEGPKHPYCGNLGPYIIGASLLGFGSKRVAINSGPKEPKGHVNEKTCEPVTTGVDKLANKR
ncbi:hypothetical protein TNCV_4606871 [Trichonephila clavipes]|nr:hypothetical protein TNCV_4606871 [Trichonephila clavipes]